MLEQERKEHAHEKRQSERDVYLAKDALNAIRAILNTTEDKLGVRSGLVDTLLDQQHAAAHRYNAAQARQQQNNISSGIPTQAGWPFGRLL